MRRGGIICGTRGTKHIDGTKHTDELGERETIMALSWWERPIALTEAVVAKHTVKLAPEPDGERHGCVPMPHDADAQHATSSDIGNGTVSPEASGPTVRTAAPFSLVVVGDSLTVGCGVEDQQEGLVPDMARTLASTINRPVQWATYGRLGATMRRVRFRLLPQVKEQPDLLVLCAGSNDVMARRSAKEWRSDLTAAIDEAKALCPHVVVISSGQVYRSPALGRVLRKAILDMTDEQTAISKRICADKQVLFVDMTHYDTGLTDDEFWAYDNFHPSKRCYQMLADGVIAQASTDF